MKRYNLVAGGVLNPSFIGDLVFYEDVAPLEARCRELEDAHETIRRNYVTACDACERLQTENNRLTECLGASIAKIEEIEIENERLKEQL